MAYFFFPDSSYRLASPPPEGTFFSPLFFGVQFARFPPPGALGKARQSFSLFPPPPQVLPPPFFEECWRKLREVFPSCFSPRFTTSFPPFSPLLLFTSIGKAGFFFFFFSFFWPSTAPSRFFPFPFYSSEAFFLSASFGPLFLPLPDDMQTKDYVTPAAFFPPPLQSLRSFFFFPSLSSVAPSDQRKTPRIKSFSPLLSFFSFPDLSKKEQHYSLSLRGRGIKSTFFPFFPPFSPAIFSPCFFFFFPFFPPRHGDK